MFTSIRRQYNGLKRSTLLARKPAGTVQNTQVKSRNCLGVRPVHDTPTYQYPLSLTPSTTQHNTSLQGTLSDISQLESRSGHSRCLTYPGHDSFSVAIQEYKAVLSTHRSSDRHVVDSTYHSRITSVTHTHTLRSTDVLCVTWPDVTLHRLSTDWWGREAEHYTALDHWVGWWTSHNPLPSLGLLTASMLSIYMRFILDNSSTLMLPP